MALTYGVEVKVTCGVEVKVTVQVMEEEAAAVPPQQVHLYHDKRRGL